MCGIYGQNFPITPQRSAVLHKWLLHRGPDAQRTENVGNAGFFHSRLSIVDAVGGSQPMHRGPLVVVFNGEIYNHQELRNQYHLSCQSRSDTETLLALYEKFGNDMLPMLDGMFAFCIYNRDTKRLLLARDRMGEKPLYYYHTKNVFAFASELNVLAANFPLELDADTLPEFLAKGWCGPDATVYKQVKSVPPGGFLEVMDFSNIIPQVDCKVWWNPAAEMLRRNQHGNHRLEEQQYSGMVKEALDNSVKRRIESSDLPVGCFLSGGIDSGIVTALAAKHASKLHTFTFSFDGMWDETDAAALVAKRYETIHTSIRLHYDTLEKDIGKILLSYGEPFADESAIPSYYIAKEAKQFVTVVLNGDGGDEVFGGYRRYVPACWPGNLRKGVELASKLLPLLPSPGSKMGYYNYGYRLLRMQQPDMVKGYLASTTDLLWDFGLSSKDVSDYSWLKSIIEQEGLTPLQQSRLADYVGLLPEVLLPKIDIATMQHSLESRTVFFSPEVLNASAAIPDNCLVSGSTTKKVLRQVARELLPESIATAPKRGFEPPIEHIVDVELAPLIKEYLFGDAYEMNKILSPDVLRKIFQRQIKMSSDRRARILYTSFTLAYWLRHRPACEINEPLG